MIVAEFIWTSASELYLNQEDAPPETLSRVSAFETRFLPYQS